ncbi:septin-7-like isoform X2 [Tachypleus tridentatus]|uniref:septin-7-like isoform X2 n=2 Tax=Tachypleus tridentatus TaxID=6853 RepID=UPI003FCEF317
MFRASAVAPPAKPAPPPRNFRGLGENINDKSSVNKPLYPGPEVLTQSPSRQLTSPISSYGAMGYRFASVERLVQRQRIYDSSQGSPVQNAFLSDASPSSLNLSTKRELFFRSDGGTSATNTATSDVKSTISTLYSSSRLTNSTKDIHLSREKDREKDTLKEREREKVSPKDMEGYVGFANLPNQVYRKAVKRGFDFTLMVVGESGLGKSTLINSMFLTDIYSNEYPGPSQRMKKTVQVETNKVFLHENGVNLTLTIVDTPGFGDAVDNSECWYPIIDYIESKYEDFLNAESRVHRTAVVDSRVHCCLYFISPGHGLKPLDIEFMKRLHEKVNIIPVIAKSDTMTPEECSQFKKTVLNELAQNEIQIYEFPDCKDEEENKLQKPLKDRIPFAIVGSNVIVESNGKRVRGRRYPWGVAEVENMEHCDFLALRNMLIRTHMQDLKDITNNVHYENYRCLKLAGVGSEGKSGMVSNKNPLAQMEEEKKDHETKMKRMEREMEQVFDMKVKEKMNKLKDSEAELHRRSEQMRKALEQQRQELYQKWKDFEKERTAFEVANKDIDETLRKLTLDTNSKEHLDGKEKKKEKKKGLF